MVNSLESLRQKVKGMNMQAPKKLPIGIQDFVKIREGDYVYVDKTQHLYNLIQRGSVYFLSRPRRFGKSLLISTLEAIFQGKKELFKDLWIANSDYDWKTYPVIRIDMSETVRTSPELLEQSLLDIVKMLAERYHINLGKPLSSSQALGTLIRSLAEKNNKAVVLIDEYDKPIIDNISDIKLALKMRNALRSFYTILKAQDGNLKFILLTGVSKFSKASVFSELNNLQDLTLDTNNATLLGYTQTELETVFDPWIQQLAVRDDHSLTEELTKIKRWYNGYQFSSKSERVYNPFSTLLLFQQQEYRVHWFETATPKFLMDILEKSTYLPEELNHFEAGETAFGTYDIERLELLPLLYQTGYLTITGFDKELRAYTLGYPNLEVEQSFTEAILSRWSGTRRGLQEQTNLNMARAIRDGHYSEFFKELKSFLASIPYDLHQPTEAYYHSIFYLIFHLLGYRIGAEVHTNIGRIDAVIELQDRVLIFEFKLDQPADVALQQIKDKKYAEPYQNTGKKIELFGVSFGTKERNVVEWKIGDVG